MKQGVFEVLENRRIARNTRLMRLAGDTSAFTAPGQFMEIRLEGFYLRRPFSVCEWTDGVMTVVYKTVGAGTKAMENIRKGAALDILTGLGNGYSLDKAGDKPLLIGGGAGVPPLYMLCKALVAQGARPVVALGFGSADEVFFEEEFAALGVPVAVATMDGTRGVAGVVLNACPMDGCTYFYACGPEAMLRAVCAAACSPGELSLEERMGCGFGACMGCAVFTARGVRRVCKDGPVFTMEELGWQT